MRRSHKIHGKAKKTMGRKEDKIDRILIPTESKKNVSDTRGENIVEHTGKPHAMSQTYSTTDETINMKEVFVHFGNLPHN